MSVSLYTAIANGESRTVQTRGVVTLPKDWRDEHGVEEGDLVAMVETDDGHLELIPPEPSDAPDIPTPE